MTTHFYDTFCYIDFYWKKRMADSKFIFVAVSRSMYIHKGGDPLLMLVKILLKCFKLKV